MSRLVKIAALVFADYAVYAVVRLPLIVPTFFILDALEVGILGQIVIAFAVVTLWDSLLRLEAWTGDRLKAALE